MRLGDRKAKTFKCERAMHTYKNSYDMYISMYVYTYMYMYIRMYVYTIS